MCDMAQVLTIDVLYSFDIDLLPWVDWFQVSCYTQFDSQKLHFVNSS